MSVDDELRVLAEQAAQRYPDATLTAAGWTRQDLVDAIHTRLRSKYRVMRHTGQLVDDHGVIRTACHTPDKHSYRSKAAALRAQRFRRLPTGEKERLYPYRCTCGAWHLTHHPPARHPHIATFARRKDTP